MEQHSFPITPSTPSAQGLYGPTNEHDACGVGFVVHIKGKKSHEIVQQGLYILHNLDHRGAVGADLLVGDGAGILLQIPNQFFYEEMAKQGVNLPPAGEYGVGMIFLPKEHASRLACEQELERTVRLEGQVVLGWRDVPVGKTMSMSPTVQKTEPVIRQIFIGRGRDIMTTDALERKLYVIRKTASHTIQALRLKHSEEYFAPSMSTRTIVYKGLLLCERIGRYYQDPTDPHTVSALALVHQRFSANTFPAWELAYPYHMVAHNGEINTIKGNVNWINARTGGISSPVLGDDLPKLWPLIYPGQSDMASFDNYLELLTMTDYPLAQATMVMIPEAWEQHMLMDDNRHAFYEYHAAMMEPWDGPAAICFIDGCQIGTTLDRNGLRPARYYVTDDDMVVMASGADVLPIPESCVVKKWRLQPGKMFLIDMEQGRVIDDKELKDNLTNAKPHKSWIDTVRIKLDELEAKPGDVAAEIKPAAELLDRQQVSAYTQEDVKFLMAPMTANGEEAAGSMGSDSPLAVLSSRSKMLYNYFRQLFAQVTSPSIDPIRENMVMSFVSFIGPKSNPLELNNINPPMRLEVSQPVLNFKDMAKIRNIEHYTGGKFMAYELDICYSVAWGKEGIEARLASLCTKVVNAVKSGYNILIVSGRAVDEKQAAIFALLATFVTHHHLVDRGLRTNTGLVVETGSAHEMHHFALLAGYGVEAVHPYLATETLAELAPSLGLTVEKAIYNSTKAIGKGLHKVMSKTGISTYISYTGTQIFEAIGLSRELVDEYFQGTASNVGGIGIFEVAEEALRLHCDVFGDAPVLVNMLDTGSEYAYRVRGEEHMWTLDSIAKLQHATRANSYQTYKEYASLISGQSKRHMMLRGLFEFKVDPTRVIPLEEVEPAKEIVKRFVTDAISLGSVSTEAYTTLIVAMNRIGGKSNAGEGGEDERRHRNGLRGIPIKQGTKLSDVIGREVVERDLELQEGDSLCSKIKQVASSRFGVTAEYLASADQIQIKMAQGAEPDEGGQLPSRKVTSYIGKLRYTVSDVDLISPPLHHDIYSIKDLAQLIHDLRDVNPRSDVSVRLVSEVGVGTVAAGVVKAKVGHVAIAGHDGGADVSPWSSTKHAGTPWELGLAETQQTLMLNGLHNHIRVQAGDQMRTGRDVVISALLGADEFGLVAAPLVVKDCIMMHKCHLNTCPVGVAMQDPVLRKRFSGKPEHVVNYSFFVAEEVREIMARLGIRTFNELIGRADLLDTKAGIEHWKVRGLDFARIFYQPAKKESEPCYQVDVQDHGLDRALDHQLIEKSRAALEKDERVSFIQPVHNVNRTVGVMLSGEVARRYGHEGLPGDSIHVQIQGTVGQSFGALLAHGTTLDLVGDGNDYVGRGLSGGRVIVRPLHESHGESTNNIVVGNTVLYGTLAGEAFFNDVAGERFVMRNSGTTAVVEGTGDHDCEYMIGGAIVVFGTTGRSFAAGMSGGVVYVYNEDGLFDKRCSTAMVALESVLSAADQEKARTPSTWHKVNGERVLDEQLLKALVEKHFRYTGSERARELLANWNNARRRFVKVFPTEYKRALTEMYEREQEVGCEQAAA